MGDTSRPIRIAGSVVMDDGSALPRGVAIKSVCDGIERTVTTPRGDGKFDFQWVGNNATQPDSTQGELDPTTSKLGLAGMSTKAGSSLGGANGDQIQNCELAVNMPGYRSSAIYLAGHSSTSNPNVGTIVMHRYGNDEGHFISVSAMQVPKDAKKAWDEGLAFMAKNQRPEAVASFQKAVGAYPKFADAWLRLGVLQLQLKQVEPAKESLHKATEIDPKLIGPWLELGFLASATADWPETAKYLDRAVTLDPTGSSKAWYLDATAHFNLKQYDDAERGVRKAIELDVKHQNPRADFLLGLVLIAREDYKGGAAALRSYMEASPNAGDLDMVRGELTRIQEFIR
jgi:Flp pilus assembly protein TadD